MMSKNREVTDKEWASAFEVRHRSFPPVIWFGANVVGVGGRLLHSRSVEAMLAF